MAPFLFSSDKPRHEHATTYTPYMLRGYTYEHIPVLLGMNTHFVHICRTFFNTPYFKTNIRTTSTYSTSWRHIALIAVIHYVPISRQILSSFQQNSFLQDLQKHYKQNYFSLSIIRKKSSVFEKLRYLFILAGVHKNVRQRCGNYHTCFD
jgi:hypothetical protein